jgi:hypothetical protein
MDLIKNFISECKSEQELEEIKRLISSKELSLKKNKRRYEIFEEVKKNGYCIRIDYGWDKIEGLQEVDLKYKILVSSIDKGNFCRINRTKQKQEPWVNLFNFKPTLFEISDCILDYLEENAWVYKGNGYYHQESFILINFYYIQSSLPQYNCTFNAVHSLPSENGISFTYKDKKLYLENKLVLEIPKLYIIPETIKQL